MLAVLPPAKGQQQGAGVGQAKAAAPAAASGLVAKDIQGLDVFSADGLQVGRVTKVNVVADGNVKDVEVRSRGFFGLFSQTYLLPADRLNKKGGRLDLSMTSGQAKQFKK